MTEKALEFATDIYDEIHHTERFPDATYYADLMVYCRSLGASTVEWILDDMWALYDDYPGGIDLLKTAVDAAHGEGLRFHVVYKPFEGGLFNLIMPHTMPRPEGAVFWEDLRGMAPIVRPFVAAHPEYCLKRYPGAEDAGRTLSAIRLVKNDERPVTVKQEEISIWTSEVNGRFTRYTGPFRLDTALEWRPLFPLGRTCRILTIDGLQIPATQRYVEVRFEQGAFGGEPFRNEYPDLVELVDEKGEVIPSTTASADPPRAHYVHWLAKPFMSRLIRYSRAPAVLEFLSDPDKIEEHSADLQAYARQTTDRMYALDERLQVATVRGKVPCLAGQLNPVYPEVRREWLRTVQFCIDRGADAVNLRASAHGGTQEQWAYGFNEPVMKALDSRFDRAAVQRLIGDAYTTFLREARDLLHANGKQIGVHLLTNFLRPRDEGHATPSREPMEYGWEEWVADIADFAVLRGAMGLREESLRYTVDRFADACRAAAIPLTYQANRRSFVNKPDVTHFDPDRLKWLEYEMDYALNHDAIAAYQLYETANFTWMDEHNEFHGSDELRELVKKFGFHA